MVEPLGGIVRSRSIRIGGDALDAAIVGFIKNEHSLLIGERTAEELKMAIGSAYKSHDDATARIRGRDLVTGLPKDLLVSAKEVHAAIEDSLVKIVTAIKNTLEETPPDLVSDLSRNGIMLAGGGALLNGLSERLRFETGMPVSIAEDPLYAVVNGAGKCVENIDMLKKILIPENK